MVTAPDETATPNTDRSASCVFTSPRTPARMHETSHAVDVVAAIEAFLAELPAC